MTTRRIAEGALALTVALALHAAAFLRLPAGAVGDAGAEGTASVSLHAMTPQLAAMIARVDLVEGVVTPDAVQAVALNAAQSGASPDLVAPPRVAAQEVPRRASAPAQIAAAPAPTVPPSLQSPVSPERISGASADRSVTDAPSVAIAAGHGDVAAPLTPPTAQRAAVSARLGASDRDSDARGAPASPAQQPELSGTAPTSPSGVRDAAERSAGQTAPLAPTPARGVAQTRAPEELAPLSNPDPVAALAVAQSRDTRAPERSIPPAARPAQLSARQTGTGQTGPGQTGAGQQDPAEAAPRQPNPVPSSNTGEARQAQAPQAAQGTGAGAQAGIRRSGAPSLAEGQRQSLLAQWGGQIRSRIERRTQRHPGLSGTVTLRLSIANDGRLVGAAIARGSGDARLDSAALQAAQRAGRFPRAPRALPGGPHIFAVPIRFAR